MKYRKDFVTNSSSSSFVCDICGRNESGYDATLRDYGFYECVNGHIMCESEATPENAREALIQMLVKDSDIVRTKSELDAMDPYELEQACRDEVDDFFYMIPEEMCPICQMKEFANRELLRYLKKENPDVIQSIRDRFKTYREFKTYLKE